MQYKFFAWSLKSNRLENTDSHRRFSSHNTYLEERLFQLRALRPSACELQFSGCLNHPPSSSLCSFYLWVCSFRVTLACFGNRKTILFTAVPWELRLLGSSREGTNCSQASCKGVLAKKSRSTDPMSHLACYYGYLLLPSSSHHKSQQKRPS